MTLGQAIDTLRQSSDERMASLARSYAVHIARAEAEGSSGEDAVQRANNTHFEEFRAAGRPVIEMMAFHDALRDLTSARS